MPRKPSETAVDRRSSRRNGSKATGVTTVLLGSAIVVYLFFTNPNPQTFESYHFVNTGLCLFLPLFAILLFLPEDPQKFGLQKGDRRQGLLWSFGLWAAMLPLLAFVSWLPEFRHTYLDRYLSQWLGSMGPVYNGSRVNLHALVYYELAMGFYMFCWEFFFRGFLLFGLATTKLGEKGALVVQALPFMLLHWSLVHGASKPWLEVVGSLPAALILGFVALRTRSFFYGFVAHWAVSATLDLILLRPFIFPRLG